MDPLLLNFLPSKRISISLCFCSVGRFCQISSKESWRSDQSILYGLPNRARTGLFDIMSIPRFTEYYFNPYWTFDFLAALTDANRPFILFVRVLHTVDLTWGLVASTFSLGEVWCVCMILSSTDLELWLFVLRSKRWIIFATFNLFIRLYLSCYRQIYHASHYQLAIK